MTKIVTFNSLRRLKDSLPHGAIQEIADKVGLDEETVRNYFGGQHFNAGKTVGFHIEAGPDGGLVTLDDSTIYDLAEEIARKNQ